MNFLAHFVAAPRALSPDSLSPLFVSANTLPDLLPLAAPRVRLRLSLLETAPRQTPDDAAITAGVMAHLQADAVFHKTSTFALAEAKVGKLVDSTGFTLMRARRFFLAHILTELALDAYLLRREPALLDTFYSACSAADGNQITGWAEAVTKRPLPLLPRMIARFAQSQYLRHYATDEGVAEGFNRLCLRARQDTFVGENEKRLVRLIGQIVSLMDAGLADALLQETISQLS